MSDWFLLHKQINFLQDKKLPLKIMENDIFASFSGKCSNDTSINITLVCNDVNWYTISNCSNRGSKIRCSEDEYQVLVLF